MPFSTYLPERMGAIKLSPAGPFIAGAHVELTLTYTAGTFGIDDTGMLKISWRTTSDMSKPQFDKPQAANFTTVEASNGAKLEVWFDRLNVRPFANTLLIRVGRGYLREGDTLTVRLGDRRQGSPGFRLQTNVEANVELKTSVDAFATYEFCELPVQPEPIADEAVEEAPEEAATEESEPSAGTIEPAVEEPVAEEPAPAEEPVAEAAPEPEVAEAAPEPEVAEAVTEPQGDETAA